MRTGHHFREIGKDLLTYGFMSALSKMGGLLLLPLLTRALSADEYGAADVIATLVMLLGIGMQLALPNALVRYFGDASSLQGRARLISTLFVFVACVSLLIALGVSFSAELLAEKLLGGREYSEFIRLGCWIALLRALASIPQTVLRMERRIMAYNLPSLLSMVLYVILALYFVIGQGSGVWGVFFAQLLAAAMLLLATLALTHKYSTLRLSVYDLRHALKYGLPLLPSFLSLWINSQLDRLLLLLFTGLGGVAVFGAAARIGQVNSFLLTVFQQGWAPYSMLLIKTSERDEVYRRLFNYYAGLFASLGLALTAVSPELFAFLLPGEYHRGYVLIPWLIGSAILHRSAALTKLGMVVGEKTAGISVASWIGVTLNFVIALFLIRAFGVAGAAIGSFVAELVFTSLLWRFSVQKSDVRFDTRAILVVLLSYIVCSILLLVVAETVAGPMSIIYRAGLVLVAIGLIGYQTIDESVLRFLGLLSRRFRLISR